MPSLDDGIAAASPEPEPRSPPAVSPLVAASRLSLVVLATLAVVMVLREMREACIPVAIALLLSYPLDPLVGWLSRRRLPRALGALVVLALVTTPVVWGFQALYGEAALLMDQLPEAARKLGTRLQRARVVGDPVGRVQEAASALEQTASQAAPQSTPVPGVTRVEVQRPGFRASEFLWSSSMGMLAAAGNAVLMLFLLYFLLASGHLYRNKLIAIAGRRKRGLTVEILSDINQRIGRFLLATLASNVVVALLTWAALSALGVNQALIWALAAGAFNSIPYFGPVLVTGALGIVSAVQFGSADKVLLVCGAALAVTTLEGWVLTPILTGKAASMNAIAVFVSLIVWSWIWGVWGTLLAVPMMTVIKAIADHVDALDWLAELLGE